MRVYLREFIAVSQTLETPHKSREGHNYTVEAGFEQGLIAEAALSRIFKQVLKEIDHKALGEDAKLDREPTTSALVRWIYIKLMECPAPVCEVRLRRGDGLSAVYSAQSSELKSKGSPVSVSG